jgi:glycosyltransferase involved in cell wall biosynthesis
MMRLAEPLVTIVIPFYHSYAEYLEECLASVVRQTYANWEAVVVDDASADERALALVERLGDSRLRLVRHERNRGQAAARNTGIRSGRGQFIMPVDCDDMLAPTHLEELMRALERHPDCGAAYADYRLFSAISRDCEYPVRDTRALLHQQWIPHPGTLVRRVLWERVNGYCEDDVFREGNEDWDYWIGVAEGGLQAVRVPEPLYFHRQHAHSITNSRFWFSDHLTREHIYARHRQLFDRFGMRRPFLAGGYRISGHAFWRKGERWRGFRLLVHAAWLCPEEFVKAASVKLRRAHQY